MDSKHITAAILSAWVSQGLDHHYKGLDHHYKENRLPQHHLTDASWVATETTKERSPPRHGVYLREAVNELVDVSGTSGGDDLMHGDLSAVVAVGDVGGDAVVEEGGLLGDDSQLLAEPAEI